MELSFTLVSDGSSDKALIHIIRWLLQEYKVSVAIQDRWADLSQLPRRPRTLVERICRSVELYPCDILFIHRDAEKEGYEKRREEIARALDELSREGYALPVAVCVVPVHMTEAWLLADEAAIRKASGNPYGKSRLSLPPLKKLEGLPDPKQTLYELLRSASGLTGRRLKTFQAERAVHRVAELTENFALLRSLPAFASLCEDVRRVVDDDNRFRG